MVRDGSKDGSGPASLRAARLENAVRRVHIPIVGLACSAGDGFALERALSRVHGVLSAYVNPVTDTVYLEVDPTVFVPKDAARILEAFGARDARSHIPRRGRGRVW